MPNKQNPAPAATGRPGLGNGIEHAQHTKPPAKWKRVLAVFAAGRRFNRFEAERELNDHCLHSTVSTIQAKGVPIERCEEVVSGFQGAPTHCCRYWLAPEHMAKALNLLGIEKWHAAD